MKKALRILVLKLLNIFPPKIVLRFLFVVDRWLYYLQGQVAEAYGNGIHPKHRHIRYHDFFVKNIDAGEKVLDIGCGNGAVAFDIAERSCAEVVGIDINARSIEEANKRYVHPKLRFVVGDILDGFPDGSYDVLVLSNVLEHLPDRPLLLRNLISKFRPTKILIRVPSFERDWRVPLKKELGVEWRLDPTHVIEYTLEEFDAEMDAAGLKMVQLVIKWGEIWAKLAPA